MLKILGYEPSHLGWGGGKLSKGYDRKNKSVLLL